MWEKVVKNTNNSPNFKASRSSRICSNHFSRHDYIKPPSETNCRLKHAAVPIINPQPTGSHYGISRNARRKIKSPSDLKTITALTPSEKVFLDHSYCKKFGEANESRTYLEGKLKRKIRGLQQQLRRTKAKQQTMTDIIQELKEKLIISSDTAEHLHAKFDHIQLSIFRDTKNNVNCAPCARRYSDAVKEFSTTINYYSPKACEYV